MMAAATEMDMDDAMVAVLLNRDNIRLWYEQKDLR